MLEKISLKESLGVMFAVSIAIANVTAAKLAWFSIPFLGEVSVPAGFVAFGLAFLCSDLMVEFYGKEYAHKVVNGTVIALVAAYALIFIAISMPVAPFYGAHEAYITTLSSSSAIVAASIITIIVSQNIDVHVFSLIKEITSGEHKWMRNVGSTGISQAIDTVIFITLAFAFFPFLQGGEPMWGMALALTIVGQYIVKLLVALADTIPFYLVVYSKND